MSELIISDNGAMTRAELDIQVSTARAYPRDENKSIQKAISRVTLTQDIAESCIYCLVRNGKDGKSEIKGGSIRLAEIMASCWGNIYSDVKIIGNDGKFITAKAMSWDLETNTKMPSEVKRRITGRDGRTFSEDMQVVTANAACSIALRNAIFRVVGKSIIDLVYDAAVKFAVGDQKTLDHKRKQVFDRFNKMGIESKKIFDFFNKNSIDEFNSEDVADLIGIGTSIKDGMIKIENAFTFDSHGENSVEDKIKNLLENK